MNLFRERLLASLVQAHALSLQFRQARDETLADLKLQLDSLRLTTADVSDRRTEDTGV